MNLVWHHGQRPESLINAACKARRVCGRVAPEVFFKAHLFLTQERKRERDQRHLRVPAQPVTPLVVIQPQFLLEFPVVQFHPPARPRHAHQASQSDRLWPPVCEPVVAGGLCACRPLDQQPFSPSLRMSLRLPPVRRPDFYFGKARTLRTFGAGTPRDRLPRGGRQGACQLGQRLRFRHGCQWNKFPGTAPRLPTGTEI